MHTNTSQDHEPILAAHEVSFGYGNGIVVSALHPGRRDPEVQLCTFTTAADGSKQRSATAWRMPLGSARWLGSVIDVICTIAQDGEKSWPPKRSRNRYVDMSNEIAPIQASGTTHFLVRAPLFFGARARDSRLVLERWDFTDGYEAFPDGEPLELYLPHALLVRHALMACYDACVEAVPSAEAIAQPLQPDDQEKTKPRPRRDRDNDVPEEATPAFIPVRAGSPIPAGSGAVRPNAVAPHAPRGRDAGLTTRSDDSVAGRGRLLAQHEVELGHGSGIIVSAVQPEHRDPEVRLRTFTLGRDGIRQLSAGVWRMPPGSARWLYHAADDIMQIAMDGEQIWPPEHAPDRGPEEINQFAPVQAAGMRFVMIRARLFFGQRARESRLILEYGDRTQDGASFPDGEPLEVPFPPALFLGGALAACSDACIEALSPTKC
jgi:hypothetical protein